MILVPFEGLRRAAFLGVILLVPFLAQADECSRSLLREHPPFLTSGVNSQETIRELKEFNGVPINKIEATMRPGVKTKEGSQGGFLGPKESLIEVLLADNELVLGHLHLTHQQLAEPLGFAVDRYWKDPANHQFEFRGHLYSYSVEQTHGVQFSPFFDQTGGSFVMTVTNLASKKSLRFASLVPVMMSRYGFYEGKQSPYRVEPGTVVEVFELK